MAFSSTKNSQSSGGPPRPPKRATSSGNKPSGKGGKGAKKFVLLLGDEGAILIFMQGAKVVRRLFAPSAQPSHSEAMPEIMQTNPSVPVTLLVDVIDQQYVPQTFPPVSALSVGGLVKRRLARDFQAEDLKGSLQIGRDKTGRKEWRYLLISLIKTPLMTEWLDLVLGLPNEMKGVYLVPVEAVNYLSQLSKKVSNAKPYDWQLLISHNKVSGFRQVVIHNGKLIFTRVSQAIDDAIPAVIAGNIEQEIINTIEYLKRLDFRESDELEATVVASQDVLDLLDLGRFSFGRTSVLNPLAVAEALGLEQAALSADRFGDVVLGAAFGISKKHTLRFTNAYIEKLSKLYLARIGIYIATVLIALLFLGLTVSSVLSAIANTSSTSLAKQKQISMQPDLKKMQIAVGNLNQDVAFKSAIVATYDAYIDSVPKIEDTLTDITPMVSPKNRIVGIVWDLTAEDKPGSSTAPAGGEKLPLDIKLSVDFTLAGNTVDVIDDAANDFLNTMKTTLVRYDATADKFPWNTEGEQKTVSLGSAGTKDDALKDTVGVFHLRGVKKVATPPPGAKPQAPNVAPVSRTP